MKYLLFCALLSILFAAPNSLYPYTVSITAAATFPYNVAPASTNIDLTLRFPRDAPFDFD